MSFKTQLCVFTKRNFILKYRNRFQLAAEISFPLLMLVFLVIFNFIYRPIYHKKQFFVSESFPSELNSSLNLYIIPNNSRAEVLGGFLKSYFKNATLKYCNDYNDLKDKYVNDLKVNNKQSFFGIEFSDQNFPFVYTIYTKWTSGLFFKNEVNMFTANDECDDTINDSKQCAGNMYVYNGLSAVKYYTDLAVKTYFTNSVHTIPSFKIQKMPKDSRTEGRHMFAGISSYYFSLFFIVSLMTFTMNVVAEKETNIKNLMITMGMYESASWLSWIVVYMVPFTVFNLVTSFVLYQVTYLKTYGIALFLFLFIEQFTITVILFGMFFSTLFKKSKNAGAVCGIFYILTSLCYYVIYIPRSIDFKIPIYAQWLLSLCFPCAFSFGIDQALWIQRLSGSTFSFEAIMERTNAEYMTLMECIIMLAINSLIYLVLTIYLECFLSYNFKGFKAFFFFLYPSYWRNRIGFDNSLTNLLYLREESIELEREIDVEQMTSHYEAAICLNNVEKTYQTSRTSSFNAIKNLNMVIYTGQITAILGNNAAGKTSLLNILTGLEKCTKGWVTVFGYDLSVKKDLDAVRKMTGYCPEQDRLYDQLSCFEHLEIFARIKEIPSNQIEMKIKDMLRKVELDDYERTLSLNLNGCQRRKLCLAIALIGDPEILILDEPTTGMDPKSRRSIWKLLQTMKKDKVILFTTHFMDEADLLADRKAILIKGELRCIGSSSFLKNKFGLGYNLNCISRNESNTENVALSNIVKSYVVDAKFSRASLKESCYSLPLNSASNFKALFQNLEASRQSIDIEYFGISMTTLEEVFSKLSENSLCKSGNDELENKINNVLKVIQVLSVIQALLSGLIIIFLKSSKIKSKTSIRWMIFKIIPIRLYALIHLRLMLFKRSKAAFVYRYLIPFINMILAITFPAVIQKGYNYNQDNLPRVNLEYNKYNTKKYWFSIINNTNYPVEDFIRKNSELTNNFTYSSTVRSLVYKHNSITGIVIEDWVNRNQNDLILLYKDSALLSLPFLLNTLTNFYSNLDNIPLINATLSSLPKIVHDDYKVIDADSFVSLILLGIGFILPAVSFVGEIIHDKELKCQKQLQLSGIGFLLYWSTSVIFFLVQYMSVPMLIFIVLFTGNHVSIFPDAFAPLSTKIVLILLTLLYMLTILILSMCLTFNFKKKENATNFLTIFFIMLMVIPFVSVDLASIGGWVTESNCIHLISTFLDPFYGLIGGYYKIFKIHAYQLFEYSIAKSQSLDPPIKYFFEYEQFFIPVSFIMGLINLVFYSCLLYFLDFNKNGINIFQKLFAKDHLNKIKRNEEIIINEDSDVSSERAKVRITNLKHCPIVLKELRKTFPKPNSTKNDSLLAIRNMSLQLEKGEIFGLLGPNGSGKTTILKLITHEYLPDNGVVETNGDAINLMNRQNFYNRIGFCPQHDSFWKDLTLYEHLVFYAVIKKIPENEIHMQCNEIAERLGIEEHFDKKIRHLSGGTKRKLAFAISMLAEPDILLLDEPTKGMDPKSKSLFWNTIKTMLQEKKTSTLLTTDSMEEAEALCHRIGIIIKGELKCLGTSQYLKDKFGMGYTLETRINLNRQSSFFVFIEQLTMQQAIIIENFANKFIINIPKDCIKSLSQMFERLEKAKSDEIIIEYSFSQCTFEQMFIQFVKAQRQ